MRDKKSAKQKDLKSPLSVKINSSYSLNTATIIAVVFFLLVLVAAIYSAQKTTSVVDESLGPQQHSQNSASNKTEDPPKEKKWVKVTSLSGSSSKRSASFSLSGAETRLVYKQTSSDEYASTSVYIVPEGDSLDRSGGFPEVTIDGNEKDETRLVQDAGEYYFDVSSYGGNWTLTIEEYR